jgi:hypothetical protein
MLSRGDSALASPGTRCEFWARRCDGKALASSGIRLDLWARRCNGKAFASSGIRLDSWIARTCIMRTPIFSKFTSRRVRRRTALCLLRATRLSALCRRRLGHVKRRDFEIRRPKGRKRGHLEGQRVTDFEREVKAGPEGKGKRERRTCLKSAGDARLKQWTGPYCTYYTYRNRLL